jgi:hypothetical protein
MSDPNSFVSPLTVENFKLKSLALKIAAIGGWVLLGTIVILFFKLISMTGVSNFKIPGLGAGGFLFLIYTLGVLGGIGYLSWILWQKSAVYAAYANDQNSETLTQALLLQKQFYQTLAMMIIGSYAIYALILLIS